MFIQFDEDLYINPTHIIRVLYDAVSGGEDITIEMIDGKSHTIDVDTSYGKNFLKKFLQ